MTRGQPDPEVIRRHLAALREVDLEILERVLGQQLVDFEAFADCVEAHLARL